MEWFVATVMTVMIVYFIRYWWVKFQCLKAIGYASYLAKDHIYKCETAFKTINSLSLPEEKKEHFKRLVHEALDKHEEYFDDYYKDYDYNKLWLSVDKWTLRQMFPNLTNRKGIEVIYE